MVNVSGSDELWVEVARRVRAELGWSLRPLRRLGRLRENRRVWLAEGEPGRIIVKLLPTAFRAERAAWSTAALDLLARRGAPVPRTLGQWQLDEHWWLAIQTLLPGEPLRVLDGPALDQLLALIDLQAAPHLGPGGWDVSWWVSVVLFEGWEGWWEGAEAAAPETARRLRAFVGPAWGHRLPVEDLVHHDFSMDNVLT